jgi:signal transduction histidine kinase
LQSALQWYVEGFAKRSGLSVQLQVNEQGRRYRPEVETAIFRVVQEGLANSHRHGSCQSIEVRLEQRNGSLHLRIADDGRGPSDELLEQFAEGGSELGVGITGMRERLEQLGGHLEIQRGAPGTVVAAWVPVKEEAA